jgi:hypothetical protein
MIYIVTILILPIAMHTIIIYINNSILKLHNPKITSKNDY